MASDELTGGRGPGTEPLSRHVVLASADLDEARRGIGNVFVPHRVDVAGPGAVAARLHAVVLDRVTFAYSRYGAPVEIGGLGAMGPCYHLNLLHRGAVRSWRGRDEVDQSRRGQGVVFTPGEGWRMSWGGDCAQVAVRIDQQALQSHFERTVGRPSGGPIAFRFALAESPAVRSFVSLLGSLVTELDTTAGSWLSSRLMVAQVEDFVMSGLLAAQPHNLSDVLTAPPGPSRPRHVRRAMDLMAERPDDPLTTTDLAAAAGVSVRTLQAAFHSHVGMSPMEFLRDVRLERVHRELADAGGGTTVTAVALRWGFGHLGRFAVAYRRKYGCSPSDTLRSGG
ncbi:AraC family transcriptional regulator [Geodermatophilus ruber]|uniref:Transcriptional regulator, AraC family n=1 Tax=Geodermatophilus ruber TaxID=504800 RepID=A0A1I4HBG2_9ACTN|nr:AraC family transcriptional regulator [Geodermatophilus ruber]SFL39629.1 transcriptional regulator, AraC family [Geodermatophilus ruber]